MNKRAIILPLVLAGLLLTSCDSIIVVDKPIEMSRIEIYTNNSKVSIGDSGTIKAIVYPSNAVNKDIEWFFSGDNGSIKPSTNDAYECSFIASTVGTGKVYAKAKDGSIVSNSLLVNSVGSWNAANVDKMMTSIDLVLPFVGSNDVSFATSENYLDINLTQVSLSLSQYGNKLIANGFTLNNNGTYSLGSVTGSEVIVSFAIYEDEISNIYAKRYTYQSLSNITSWPSDIEELLVTNLGETIPFVNMVYVHPYLAYGKVIIEQKISSSFDIHSQLLDSLSDYGYTNYREPTSLADGGRLLVLRKLANGHATNTIQLNVTLTVDRYKKQLIRIEASKEITPLSWKDSIASELLSVLGSVDALPFINLDYPTDILVDVKDNYNANGYYDVITLTSLSNNLPVDANDYAPLFASWILISHSVLTNDNGLVEHYEYKKENSDGSFIYVSFDSGSIDPTISVQHAGFRITAYRDPINASYMGEWVSSLESLMLSTINEVLPSFNAKLQNSENYSYISSSSSQAKDRVLGISFKPMAFSYSLGVSKVIDKYADILESSGEWVGSKTNLSQSGTKYLYAKKNLSESDEIITVELYSSLDSLAPYSLDEVFSIRTFIHKDEDNSYDPSLVTFMNTQIGEVLPFINFGATPLDFDSVRDATGHPYAKSVQLSTGRLPSVVTKEDFANLLLQYYKNQNITKDLIESFEEVGYAKDVFTLTLNSGDLLLINVIAGNLDRSPVSSSLKTPLHIQATII